MEPAKGSGGPAGTGPGRSGWAPWVGCWHARTR